MADRTRIARFPGSRAARNRSELELMSVWMKQTEWALVSMACLLVAWLASGCDPGTTFHYRNNSDEQLFVTVDDTGRDRLPPKSAKNLGYFSSELSDADDPLTIVIADARGCVVLKLDTTLREFRRDQDSTISLNPSDLPPPDERTDCDPNLAD